MKKIGIIVAMTSEYGLVKSLLDGGKERLVRGIPFIEGRMGEVDVVFARR